jgi:hypothetical protein
MERRQSSVRRAAEVRGRAVRMAPEHAPAHPRQSEADRVRHPVSVDWFNRRRLFEPIGNIPPAKTAARFNLHDRVGDRAVLERHVQAWQHRHNAAAIRADWQFATQDARIKLRKLYPTIQG